MLLLTSANTVDTINSISVLITSIMAALTGGLGIIGIIISAIASLLSFAIAVLLYVFQSLGLYKMAQRAGHDSAWLAWIPIADVYLLAILSNKEFNLFNLIKTKKRDLVFAIFLVLSLAGSAIVGIISGVLSIIPIIGALIGFLLPIALTASLLLIKWRFYYDLFICFGKKDNAMVFSIISVIFKPFYQILLFTMRDSSPDYGDGNFYNTFHALKSSAA